MASYTDFAEICEKGLKNLFQNYKKETSFNYIKFQLVSHLCKPAYWFCKDLNTRCFFKDILLPKITGSSIKQI